MLIDQIEADVKALIAEPIPDDETAVDWAGRVGKMIADLTGFKRMLISEIPGPTTGGGYQLVEYRSAKRSYNTAALRRDFEKVGLTLDDLIERRAVSLTWRWTELRNEAIAADIGLRIAGHELDGDDEADHVGEHWVTERKIEGRAF